MKDFFCYLGGIVAFIGAFQYAVRVWIKKVDPCSPASWLMWFVINSIALVTTILSGKPMYLPLSYVVGSASVTIALFMRGRWQWSYKETICAVAAAIATVVWILKGPEDGLVACVIALTAAGVPILLDMFKEPDLKTLAIWTLTSAGCIFTLLGSDWTLTGSILGWGGLAFNGSLSVLVYWRGRRSDSVVEFP